MLIFAPLADIFVAVIALAAPTTVITTMASSTRRSSSLNAANALCPLAPALVSIFTWYGGSILGCVDTLGSALLK